MGTEPWGRSGRPGAASPALGTAQGTGPQAAPAPAAPCARVLRTGGSCRGAALGSGVAGFVLKMRDAFLVVTL